MVYWKADFYNEVTTEMSAQLLAFGSSIPTSLSQMHMYPLSGAAGRVPQDATPWTHRDAKHAGVIVGVNPSPENADKITKWCREYWDALHPFSSGGVYLNFIMDEGQPRIEANYKDNYKRLTGIKKKYDPNNFFRVNQNIVPN